jgi:hypothetical protein
MSAHCQGFRRSGYHQVSFPLTSNAVSPVAATHHRTSSKPAESLVYGQRAGDPSIPGVNRRAEPARAASARCRAPPARTRQLTR